MLIEGKDVGCNTLEEEEGALHKDVPQHGRDQDTTEVPEYLINGEKISQNVLFVNYTIYNVHMLYNAMFKLQVLMGQPPPQLYTCTCTCTRTRLNA